MASPQLEDGYVRIANELYDRIASFDFTKRQYKVLLVIMRLTYGHNRTTAETSTHQIATRAGLAPSHVRAALRELVEIGCALKRSAGDGYVVGIKKDYARWTCGPKRSAHTKTVRLADQNGPLGADQNGAPTVKDSNSNYNNTKNTPLPPEGVSPSSPKQPKSPKKKTSAPLFENFEITDGMRDWFHGKGWTAGTTDVLNQTEMFFDHHRGLGEKRVDWIASWRKWMTNWQTNFGRGGPPSRPANGASRQYQQRTGPQPHKFHPDDPLLKESPNVIG